METPSVKRRSKETSKVFMTTELLSFILSTTHSVSSGREKKIREKKQVHTLRKFLLGYFFFLNYLRHFLLGILGLYPEERALLVFSRFTVETSCLQSLTLSTGPALFQGTSCIRPLLRCWNPLSVCVYLLPRKKWKKMARFQTVL